MAVDVEIPCVDISSCLDPSDPLADRDRVVEEVREACERFGFLSIKGHSVPLRLQQDLLASCKRLFGLPQEKKDALSLHNNPARRGYEKIGGQVLDANALPDFKEGFYLGREISKDDMSFLSGPNQWPELPANEFHRPVMEYYEHMLRLGKAVLEMLVLGLGHDISTLQRFTEEPVVNLKLLHYPKHVSVDSRQFGAGAHTDFGGITILLQQPGKHGLQVYYKPSDTWIPVPASEDIFVVNMGDLVQKWTEGRYSSTLHRVINATDGDRYSVPCFYHGDMSATNPFNPSDNSETVEQHIPRKFDNSYGIAGK